MRKVTIPASVAMLAAKGSSNKLEKLDKIAKDYSFLYKTASKVYKLLEPKKVHVDFSLENRSYNVSMDIKGEVEENISLLEKKLELKFRNGYTSMKTPNGGRLLFTFDELHKYLLIEMR